MKRNSLILLLIFILGYTIAYSQVTISADSPKGCNTLSVTFSYTSTISVSNQKWFFGDNDSSILSNPKHLYTKPGIYKVKLLVNDTDTFYYNTSIQVSETPRINIEHRDTVSDSYLVVALQAAVYNESKLLFKPLQYTWKIEGTPVGTSKIIGHKFDSAGIYSIGLSVYDSYGCTAIDSIKLPIFDTPTIPNVFTPNNDTQNDLFKFTLNGQTVIDFQVFTRTGLLVYKTKTANIEWDGKRSSGEDVTSGMYYYIMEAEDVNPPLVLKGFIYIYR